MNMCRALYYQGYKSYSSVGCRDDILKLEIILQCLLYADTPTIGFDLSLILKLVLRHKNVIVTPTCQDQTKKM